MSEGVPPSKRLKTDVGGDDGSGSQKKLIVVLEKCSLESAKVRCFSCKLLFHFVLFFECNFIKLHLKSVL